MPCSPKLRACVDDLIAQGKPESSAWAICRSQIGESIRRHFDFERVYGEFLNYYKDPELADQEYYDWISVMRLDETKEYGQLRESFYWKKDDLQFIREDADNKYYEVMVGFPLKSMNNNPYKERDLIAAALRLQGKHPSLNHKNEFWFSPANPRNRWGNIPIMEGKYHEGACKALVKVPKQMLCPICGGTEKMVDLIDKKRIVNVSLEGNYANGCQDGNCEGFYFTDPPFTFLTTDVLPGIPLTKIRPIEAFLPFSQSSNHNDRGKITLKIKENQKKMKTLVLKPKEQADPAKMGKDKPPQADINTNVYNQPYATTPDGPSGENTQFRGNLQDVSQQTQVAMGSDPAAAKPEGIWQTSIIERAEQIIKERNIITEADYPWDQCVADQTAQYGDEETAKKVCAAIKNRTVSHQNYHEDALPAGGSDAATPAMGPDTASKPPTQPQAQSPSRQECPEGKHWDDSVGDCVPSINAEELEPADILVDEKAKRLKAEGKAKSAEEQAVQWEQAFRQEAKLRLNAQAKATALEQAVKRQEQRADEAIRQLRNQEVTTEEWHKKWEREVALREEYKQQVETHQEENKRLSEKYQKALATNLKLSQDVTKANEDYLEIAQTNEKLQEAYDKQRIGAKKILKIRPS